jgi:Fic family protein
MVPTKEDPMERLDARLKELPPAGIHDLVVRISGIDECKGWWKGRGNAFPTDLRRMMDAAIPVSADASARISARNALPSSEPPPWGKKRPVRRGGADPPKTGYAELLRSVCEEHRAMEFGKELVLRFHAQLLKDSPADRAHRGRYRSLMDRPGPYRREGMESLALRPTEPHLVHEEMRILTEWTEARLGSPDYHPLLVIASFLLEFLAIRPFADGNGRMSRILAHLLLLKQGYEHVPCVPLDRIIADRMAEIQIALRRAQARRNFPRPDILPWLRAFLDVLQAQAAELRSLLEGRPREDLLSDNQRAVLSLFDRHREVTIRLAHKELGIPRDTAKQVLGRLHRRNLVLRAGAGRASRYQRPPSYPDGRPSPGPAR